MEMTPATPNDPFYMVAPVSPSRISMEVGGLCFFSVPTSATRRTLRNAYEDSSSNVDEFEFDTSHRFHVDEYELESKQKPDSLPEEPKESLPDMAFADELFSDGKVMPLKPLPRIEYHKQASKSSPKSSTGVLRLPFQSRSLWNDDFDPFMVALENVKEEKGKYHRRARSMSPFRERETIPVSPLTRDGNYSGQLVLHSPPDYQPERVKGDTIPSGSSNQIINEIGLVLPTITKQSDPNSNMAMESNESENKEMGRQEHVKPRQLKLAELKGVVFARRTMPAKVGNEKTRKPSVMDSTILEAGPETGVAYTKQSKGHKIKNFLFRSESMRKMSPENKAKCYANGTEWRPKLKRKFSLKAMGITKYNEEKKVSEVTALTTLVQYKPKLLLCMGYGDKYVK